MFIRHCIPLYLCIRRKEWINWSEKIRFAFWRWCLSPNSFLSSSVIVILFFPTGIECWSRPSVTWKWQIFVKIEWKRVERHGMNGKIRFIVEWPLVLRNKSKERNERTFFFEIRQSDEWHLSCEKCTVLVSESEPGCRCFLRFRTFGIWFFFLPNSSRMIRFDSRKGVAIGQGAAVWNLVSKSLEKQTESVAHMNLGWMRRNRSRNVSVLVLLFLPYGSSLLALIVVCSERVERKWVCNDHKFILQVNGSVVTYLSPPILCLLCHNTKDVIAFWEELFQLFPLLCHRQQEQQEEQEQQQMIHFGAQCHQFHIPTIELPDWSFPMVIHHSVVHVQENSIRIPSILRQEKWTPRKWVAGSWMELNGRMMMKGRKDE